MPVTNKHYVGRTYIFHCKHCKIKNEFKKVKFAFMRSQKGGLAILKCNKCGLLISRAKRRLDEQIPEGSLDIKIEEEPKKLGRPRKNA